MERPDQLNAMPDRDYICRLDEIADPGSRGFKRALGEQEEAFFLVRQGDSVNMYRNHCPHTGINLEWMPDQFLDIDNAYIQCSLHAALFDIQSGLCVRGPCVGESLKSVAVEISDGAIYMLNDALTPEATSR